MCASEPSSSTHLDVDVDRRQARGERRVLEALRPDAEHDAAGRPAARGERHAGTARSAASPSSTVASTRFIAGEPMKAAMKRLFGSRVELLRPVDWQDAAVAHHRDALAERHRFGLVVRHVDGRDAEALVQLRQRGAHADAELRVEVRERLVEQERLRLADDRAAHRDALALAAGELRRLAVEQVGEAEQLGDLVDAARDLASSACGAPSARSPCSGARSCAGRARRSGRPSRCRGSAARGR